MVFVFLGPKHRIPQLIKNMTIPATTDKQLEVPIRQKGNRKYKLNTNTNSVTNSTFFVGFLHNTNQTQELCSIIITKIQNISIAKKTKSYYSSSFWMEHIPEDVF